jgi:hypothetical protein
LEEAVEGPEIIHAKAREEAEEIAGEIGESIEVARMRKVEAVKGGGCEMVYIVQDLVEESYIHDMIVI